MKRTATATCILTASILALASCVIDRGDFRGQETNARVELTKANYRIVKSMASGSSSGFWLFGIIPITSPSVADARREMYESSGLDFQNRSLALINQVDDLHVTWFILFSIRKRTLSADIIEFQPEAR